MCDLCNCVTPVSQNPRSQPPYENDSTGERRVAPRWQQRVRKVIAGGSGRTKLAAPPFCFTSEIREENESLTCQTQMPQHMERCHTEIFLWLLNRRHLTSHSVHHDADLSFVSRILQFTR